MLTTATQDLPRDSQSLLRTTMRMMRQYDCWRLRRYLSIGDPARGAIQGLGGATALRFEDVGYFNRVYDFGAETVDRLEELLDFYRLGTSRSSPDRASARRGVELIAREGYDLTEAAGALRRHGFHPCKRIVRLGMDLTGAVACADEPIPAPVQRDADRTGSNPRLRELACPADVDAMLSLYLEGFQAPREGHAAAKVNMRELLGRPELRTWVACRDSEMIGLGMLYCFSRTALLAAGVTRADCWQQGIHQRLIELRIRKAIRMGCRSIVTWTDHGGASHRNLRAQGMRELRVERVWRNDVSESSSAG